RIWTPDIRTAPSRRQGRAGDFRAIFFVQQPKVICGRRMEKVSRLAPWVNLIVISGTWGSSFVLVKLITESMHPFAFAAARGFIAMTALLAWLALTHRPSPSVGDDLRRPPWRTIGQMLVLGTTNGWLVNVLTATAVSHVDSAVV